MKNNISSVGFIKRRKNSLNTYLFKGIKFWKDIYNAKRDNILHKILKNVPLYIYKIPMKNYWLDMFIILVVLILKFIIARWSSFPVTEVMD